MDQHAILLAAASLSGPGLPGQAQIEARQRRAAGRGEPTGARKTQPAEFCAAGRQFTGLLVGSAKEAR